MEIIWCAVWASMTLAVMYLTIKYYLPVLDLRLQKTTSGAPTSQTTEVDDSKTAGLAEKLGETDQKRFFKSRFLSEKRLKIALLICISVFAILTGYVASERATSALDHFKMAITFFVLVCVFITDLELYIIPNMCSLVILGARVITIAFEAIVAPESFLGNVQSSFIALVGSFLFLLLMSFLTRGGIGMGDVKILSSIGFMCGLVAVCYILVLAFVTCAICSTVLLLARKKKMKDSLPLGPFILVGFGLSIILTLI